MLKNSNELEDTIEMYKTNKQTNQTKTTCNHNSLIRFHQRLVSATAINVSVRVNSTKTDTIHIHISLVLYACVLSHAFSVSLDNDGTVKKARNNLISLKRSTNGLIMAKCIFIMCHFNRSSLLLFV